MKLQEGQRVRLIQSPTTGTNMATIRKGGTPEQARAGFLALHGQRGTVEDVSETIATVQVDNGPLVLVDRQSDSRVELLAPPIVIDQADVADIDKLTAFATDQGLTLAQAVLRLVERALDGI